jgi:hypothetical protein
MTFDPKSLPGDGHPSTNLHDALVRYVGELHPDLPEDDRTHIAAAIHATGAAVLNGKGELTLRASHTGKVRAILDQIGQPKPEPKIDARTRDGRSVQREELYKHRIAKDAADRAQRKRVDFVGVNKRMADAIAADPGLTRNPARRAALREQLTRAAYADAGVPVPNVLDANGVSS